MSKDSVLRENLLALLTGEHSRMSMEEVLEDFPLERINENFPGGNYSPWSLLEHIRRTQEDIVDFIKNPEYKYRQWPKDYWPEKGKPATAATWKKSVKSAMKDLAELQEMVQNPKRDIYAEVPWGEGETFLREIVTVANHNAFHLGEFAIMRMAMGTWPKGRKG